MAPVSAPCLNRRDLLRGAALLALAMGLPGPAAALDGLAADDMPSERQVRLMDAVAQAILPATDTPGAGDVGAGAFAALALAHGLDGTRRAVAASNVSGDLGGFQRPDGSLRHVAWLEATLDGACGGDWLAMPANERHGLLAAIDADAFAAGADAHPWRAIKGLVVTGYYTSEPGGSQELAYAAIPGRFDPRVAVTPATRAYSNDWTSVDFG